MKTIYGLESARYWKMIADRYMHYTHCCLCSYMLKMNWCPSLVLVVNELKHWTAYTYTFGPWQLLSPSSSSSITPFESQYGLHSSLYSVKGNYRRIASNTRSCSVNLETLTYYTLYYLFSLVYFLLVRTTQPQSLLGSSIRKYVSALSSTIIKDHFTLNVRLNCLSSRSVNLLKLHVEHQNQTKHDICEEERL